MANYQNWQTQRVQNQDEQYINLKNRHLFNNQQLNDEAASNLTNSNERAVTNPIEEKLPEGWGNY
jgi:hypothetical protein